MRGAVATVIIASGIVLAAVAADATAAAPPAPEPERPRLRLDESPALTLLRTFRDPEGRPSTSQTQWARGRYGRWLHKSLGGWSFVADNHHWFQAEPAVANPGAPKLAVPLELPPGVMPPWLLRVDQEWAGELIQTAGCGRGGPCSIGESFPADAFVSLLDVLAPRQPAPPWWVCRERPLRVSRFGGEQVTLVPLHCDGSIPEGALEELTILARPPEVARPDALPRIPDPRAEGGEWSPGVRMLHPRLLWVIHRLALAFPWHGIHIYSGYRPAPDAAPGSHTSRHALGHALDLSMQGVSNEDVLSVCAELADVACGYYPNSKFVHVDIRPYGGLWVDASAPSQPSRYVPSWPGVVENGRVVHKRKKP